LAGDSDNSDNSIEIPEMPDKFQEFNYNYMNVELFPDYKERVLEDYRSKKEAGSLSIRLIHPAPAKLKTESKAVCTSRYQKKDDRTLNDFFGQEVDQEAYLKAIGRCHPDKFKPLVKFLRGETETTNDKNIELLAWLIDFKDRPYKMKYVPDLPEESIPRVPELPGLVPIASGSVVFSPEQNEEKRPPSQVIYSQRLPSVKTRRTTIIIVVILFALFGIGVYWINKPIRGPQGCMYWAGDHYQQILCTQSLGDTLLVPLDTGKLMHFKRITNLNTIVHASVGSVWYANISGNIELFTSDGFHPIYQKIRLKPLSDYIIKKYIHPDREAAQISK
jgi:hypothetical protein